MQAFNTTEQLLHTAISSKIAAENAVGRPDAQEKEDVARADRKRFEMTIDIPKETCMRVLAHDTD
jgi:hypothetical protein